MTPTAGSGRPPALGAQGTLFDEDVTPGDDVGFRGPTACKAAGITYRQLDYWARTDLVVPTVRGAAGSGSQRLYSFRDILVLKVVKRLLAPGRPRPGIRTVTSAPASTAKEVRARLVSPRMAVRLL